MKARLIVAPLLLAFLVLVLAIGGSYYLAERAVSASDHRWCQTLDLLTSQPPPASEGAAARELYQDFLTLRRQDRC